MIPDPLDCQRDSFSLPRNLHYFNNAYLAPYSHKVKAAGTTAIQGFLDPSWIEPHHFFDEIREVRELFAQLVNATDPDRVSIIPAASYGIATVVRNLQIEPKQNIILAAEQFPSNVYSWRRLESQGIELRFVAPPKTPKRAESWSNRILESINNDTAVVTLGHVHWSDGSRFALKEIGIRAREVGAAFIIDGTQSVGALPFDIRALQPDALICAGYKWLMGPYGIGLAWYGSRFNDGIPLEESWIDRLGSQDFTNLVNYQDEYRPGSLRYDVGEPSNFILMPMLKAALKQIINWDPARIQTYAEVLTRDLFQEIVSFGYTIEAKSWRGSHLTGLGLPPGIDPEHLRYCLSTRNVVLSFRGQSIRISTNVYNDEKDFEALGEALRAALQID